MGSDEQVCRIDQRDYVEMRAVTLELRTDTATVMSHILWAEVASAADDGPASDSRRTGLADSRTLAVVVARRADRLVAWGELTASDRYDAMSRVRWWVAEHEANVMRGVCSRGAVHTCADEDETIAAVVRRLVSYAQDVGISTLAWSADLVGAADLASRLGAFEWLGGQKYWSTGSLSQWTGARMSAAAVLHGVRLRWTTARHTYAMYAERRDAGNALRSVEASRNWPGTRGDSRHDVLGVDVVDMSGVLRAHLHVEVVDRQGSVRVVVHDGTLTRTSLGGVLSRVAASMFRLAPAMEEVLVPDGGDSVVAAAAHWAGMRAGRLACEYVLPVNRRRW